MVLLAVAANDKLAGKYQDILFAKENLSLLSLLVGGQKYIEVFIGKFCDVNGIYNEIKDQTIQLGESSKVDFFQAIALRKEQELLKTVLVEYVLRNLEPCIKNKCLDSYMVCLKQHLWSKMKNLSR
ncbi:MAG: hypothetical protein ACR5KV_07255 [Wolbachia sp.]